MILTIFLFDFKEETDRVLIGLKFSFEKFELSYKLYIFRNSFSSKLELVEFNSFIQFYKC